MVKSGFILALLFTASFCFGQTIEVFNTKLFSERLSQCDLISKYLVGAKHYEFYVIDTAYYGITADGNCSNISGTYNFAVRDDSLCQVYFMASFPRLSTSLKDISITVDSLIAIFTQKYGQAETLTDNRKDSAKPEVIDAYTLLIAAWWINGDRLRIDLSFTDSSNNDRSHYGLRIHRFRECYADRKFSSRWNLR